jgi:hypothetical protein
LIFPNGEKYEGEFKDGKRHGRGFETTADGRAKLGYWLDDVYVGKEMPEELEQQ